MPTKMILSRDLANRNNVLMRSVIYLRRNGTDNANNFTNRNGVPVRSVIFETKRNGQCQQFHEPERRSGAFRSISSTDCINRHLSSTYGINRRRYTLEMLQFKSNTA